MCSVCYLLAYSSHTEISSVTQSQHQKCSPPWQYTMCSTEGWMQLWYLYWHMHTYTHTTHTRNTHIQHTQHTTHNTQHTTHNTQHTTHNTHIQHACTTHTTIQHTINLTCGCNCLCWKYGGYFYISTFPSVTLQDVWP